MRITEQKQVPLDDNFLQANRQHKSSVFALLFSKPDILRELYSAIEGVELPPDVPIKINTLSNALIKGKINDISFTVDNRLIILFEHQSTLNDNMPLRIFNYIQRLYQQTVNLDNIYDEKLIKIPRPEFIVLYNGEKPFSEKGVMKLSDAFMDTKDLVDNKLISLELIVQVYNINHGQNTDILHKCETLNGYSILIDKIREYLKTELTLAKAIKSAVKYCIENNVLKEFLMEHGADVEDLLFAEYNFETHLDTRYREGQEDGIEKRDAEILQLIKQGWTLDQIKEHLEQKR